MRFEYHHRLRSNTAIGFEALSSNTTAVTTRPSVLVALSSNTTGIDNTAIGYAMHSPTQYPPVRLTTRPTAVSMRS